MSRENVEVVERFESLMVPSLDEDDESAAHGGFEQVLQLLAPDCAFHATKSIPHGGDYVGADGFRNMSEQFRELWELVGDVELEYVDGGGDRVFTLASFTIRSRHTGKEAAVRMVEVVTVRDGKIVDLAAYYQDTVPIIEAADGVKGRYNV